MEKNYYYAVSHKGDITNYIDVGLRVFSNKTALNNFLNTEEYDFREREVISRDEALEILGDEIELSIKELDSFQNDFLYSDEIIGVDYFYEEDEE